ncbi:MAG: hypothetical protein J6S14_12025 [Clostridia bacterium]|nr:hypothetical protein [Clostridia bacterium]
MGWDDYGEKTPTVGYGPVDGDYCVFYMVCPKCGRFVKADDSSKYGEYLHDEPNATCKKCGRVQMPFCCWWNPEDDII